MKFIFKNVTVRIPLSSVDENKTAFVIFLYHTLLFFGQTTFLTRCEVLT